MNQTLPSGRPAPDRPASDQPAYVLGVDAGGTRTRAVLANAHDGRVLGEGVSGPGNALTVPVERVIEHLVEAIGAALRGVPPGRVVAVAGGFAGAASVRAGEEGENRGPTGVAGTPGEGEGGNGSGPVMASARTRTVQPPTSPPASAEGAAAVRAGEPTSADRTTAAPEPENPSEEPGRRHARTALTTALDRLGIPLPTITIHSDIEAAFASAPGHPADGLALIAGTGSVAARVQNRVLTATSGGDGWLLGDDGSGFWIGRRAVRAALRAADGRDGPTSLVGLVGRALGVPEGVLPPSGWENAPDEPSPAEAAQEAAEDASPSGAEEGGPTDDSSRQVPPSDREGAATHGAVLPAVPDAEQSVVPPGPTAAGVRREALPARPAEARQAPAPPGDPAPSDISMPDPGPATQPDAAADRPAETPPPRWGLSQRAAYRAHLLPAVMERRPTALAAHAPLVTRAADEGDEVARQILQEAAAALVETVTALAPAPGEPLVVTGGLLAPDGPLLPPLTDLLAPFGLTISPVTDGSTGAVALARLAAGH